MARTAGDIDAAAGRSRGTGLTAASQIVCCAFFFSFFRFPLFSIDPIPKSFIATMLTQVHCESPAPIGSDTTARIDGCLMIDVPGEGQQQLYDYVRSLLESSHDAYWPMIGQTRGRLGGGAKGAGAQCGTCASTAGR